MSTRQLFSFIFFVAILARLVVSPSDPDMWWHLRTGEYIINNGIPDADPGWSFITEGREWFMHEWLSEVIMWVVYEIGEIHGVMMLFSLTLASIFFLLYFASEHKPFFASFVTLFGLIASANYLGPRPQMFNLLLGALYILIIEKVRLKKIDKKWMIVLPLTMILWVNLHSGFLLGLVILGVYIIGGIIENSTGSENRLSWDKIRYFSLIGFAMTLAALINPNTYSVWFYPFSTTFSSSFMQSFIVEWFSPDFHDIQTWGFGAYLGLGIVLIARSKRPITPTELLFLIGTISTSLLQRRNIPIHAITTVPIYSRHVVSALNLETIAAYKPIEINSTLKRLNLLLATFMVLVALVYVSRTVSNYDQVVEDTFPMNAIAYLEGNELDDKRIFSSYNWGGYLIWRDIPTFVDGRADLFGDDLLLDYITILFGGDEWQQLLAKYEVEVAMIDKQSPLDELLKLKPEWETVFEDDAVVIYQQKMNENYRW